MSAVPRDAEERASLQTLVKRATRSRDQPWQPGTGFITKGKAGIKHRSTWGWRGLRRKEQP